jgi:hypothetical protein
MRSGQTMARDPAGYASACNFIQFIAGAGSRIKLLHANPPVSGGDRQLQTPSGAPACCRSACNLLILLEAGVGIEPAYTALQAVSS